MKPFLFNDPLTHPEISTSRGKYGDVGNILTQQLLKSD